MPTADGWCPCCEQAGPVGTPCPEKVCSIRGYHRIAPEWFRKVQAIPPARRDALVGRLIGDFLVVDLLGGGGFGKVYLVLQQPIQMKAALKVMHRDALDPATLASLQGKFLAEAQALAALSHPNIVRLLKYGHEADLPYLVMEFVPGVSLKQRISDLILRGEDLPEDAVSHVVVQVLNALEAAHSIGLVHRDIKPENLMIQEIPGDSWHTKVLDFGLAKFLEGSRDTSMMIGTPQYMAPEQIARKNIGPWTDLYAVGVLVFELITGRRPFAGRTTQEILGKKLDPNYDVTTRVADLDVPSYLKDFFRVAMARNVADRISTAGQFRRAFLQVMERLREGQKESRVSVDLSTLLDSSDLARLQQERQLLEAERIRLEQERERIEEEKRRIAIQRPRMDEGKASEEPRTVPETPVLESTLPGGPAVADDSGPSQGDEPSRTLPAVLPEPGPGAAPEPLDERFLQEAASPGRSGGRRLLAAGITIGALLAGSLLWWSFGRGVEPDEASPPASLQQASVHSSDLAGETDPGTAMQPAGGVDLPPTPPVEAAPPEPPPQDRRIAPESPSPAASGPNSPRQAVPRGPRPGGEKPSPRKKIRIEW